MSQLALLLLLLLLTAAHAHTVSPSSLPLWPMPASITLSASTPNVSIPSFKFLSSSSSPSKTLLNAFTRYTPLTFPHGTPSSSTSSSSPSITSLLVHIESTDETLQQGTNESYTLRVPADGSGQATLTAVTVYGALRGLETFSQAVQYDYESGEYSVYTIDVVDEPRFSYRGLLVDTSRHFEPVGTLRRIVDSMSYAKLSVLHWHIVDSQSFPMQSHAYPRLWEGAYSAQERYSTADMEGLVEYARQRGVRVMVELDGPGHAYAWGTGYPDILPAGIETAPGCPASCPPKAGNPCDVPLDPSSPTVFPLLDGVYGELTGGKQGAGVFPEDFFHLGGDEVRTACWNNSARIKSFMQANNMTTFDDLYAFFVKKVHQMAIAKGRDPVCWEEVFNAFGTSLDKRTIVHVWLDSATLKRVVAAGYRGIMSDNAHLYLDHLNTNFTAFYSDDPLTNITGKEQQDLVLGAEVCMWGETADTSEIVNTIWPRAAAQAEKLWSPASKTTDASAALPRYSQFRCLLNSRGIDAGPVYEPGRSAPPGPGSCYTQ